MLPSPSLVATNACETGHYVLKSPEMTTIATSPLPSPDNRPIKLMSLPAGQEKPVPQQSKPRKVNFHPLSQVRNVGSDVSEESSETASVDTDAVVKVQHPRPVRLPVGYPTDPTTGAPSIMDRPGMVRFYSTPSLSLSPTRQHFRIPNVVPRTIKETLDASMHINDAGKAINQYLTKAEIGRGTFGTVWLVADTTTNEQFVSYTGDCFSFFFLFCLNTN